MVGAVVVVGLLLTFVLFAALDGPTRGIAGRRQSYSRGSGRRYSGFADDDGDDDGADSDSVDDVDIAVAAGASRFFSGPARPKMVLSEVWRTLKSKFLDLFRPSPF